MKRVYLLMASDVEDAIDRAIEEATRGDYRVRVPRSRAVATDRGGGWWIVSLDVWRASR